MKTPWNPSRKATNRIKNPLPPPESCQHCGSVVVIKRHEDIYNGRAYGDWPWVYACNTCDAYVGIHPFTNIPLGTLANAETREARKRCKEPFQQYVKTHNIERGEAYRRLAEKMGIAKEECHFGWFDVEQCEKALQAIRMMQQQHQ